jgi:hypothetical protein
MKHILKLIFVNKTAEFDVFINFPLVSSRKSVIFVVGMEAFGETASNLCVRKCTSVAERYLKLGVFRVEIVLQTT